VLPNILTAVETNVKYMKMLRITCKQLVQDDCLLATTSRER